MKTSLQVSNLKFSLGAFKFNLELGWASAVTLLACTLIFGIARVGMAKSIEDQYKSHCQMKQTQNLVVEDRFNIPEKDRVDMYGSCMIFEIPAQEIALDLHAWGFMDVYGRHYKPKTLNC